MNKLLTATTIVIVLAMMGTICTADDGFGGCEDCHPDIAKNFSTSLHYTGAGMMNEYASGAAGYFGIDMDEYYTNWSCSKCHVATCTQCHFGYENSSGWGHGEQAEITIAQCDSCHFKKQSSTYMGDMPGHKTQGPSADIHYTAGLICSDCHTSEELHGTGVVYSTQLEAVSVQCIDCHGDPEKVFNGTYITQYSSETYSHRLHGDKLSCISCHSSWVLSCNGCHLSTRTGTKPVSDEFYLGVDHTGQITTFLKMDATYNNSTHTGFGAWYGHVATDEPHDCSFCHENAEVLLAGYTIGGNAQMIGEGGSLIDNETVERVIRIGMSEEGKEPIPHDKGSFWGNLFDWISGWPN